MENMKINVILLCVLQAFCTVLSQELGTNWQYVHGLFAKQCDIVNDNTLWCVDKKNNIYKHVLGELNSEQVSGKIAYISAGPAGVWGVRGRKLFYRTKTYKDPTATGGKWKRVPGAIKTIGVGDGLVVAVNKINNVFVRTGISAKKPFGKSWKRLRGKCKRVDVSGTSDLWCINMKNFVFRYQWSTEKWVKVSGKNRKMADISTGPAGVWAVGNNKRVNYREGTRKASEQSGSKWVSVGTIKLNSISSGESVIVGTTNKNRIYIRYGVSDDNTEGTGSWRTISTVNMKQCSATGTDNTFWCVTKNKKVFQFDMATKSWGQVGGTLTNTAAGPSGVWGLRGQNIFYREGTFGNPDEAGTKWTRVKGAMKTISVGENIVIGTTKQKRLFFRDGVTAENPTGNSWKPLPGKLKRCSIQSTPETIWCISNKNMVYKYLPDTKKWSKVDRKMRFVSAGAAGVWAVSKANKVYHRWGTYNKSDETGTSWGNVPRDMKTVSVGKATLVGVTQKNEVYLRLGIAFAEDEALLQYVDLDFSQKK